MQWLVWAFLCILALTLLNRPVVAFYGDFPYGTSIFGYVVPISCDFTGANRLELGGPSPTCPYRETYNSKTHNVTIISGNLTQNTTQLAVTGAVGWCGRYDYPYNDVFNIIGSRFFGTPEHSLYVSMPMPWCVTSSIFFTCVAPRGDSWRPASILYNRRPLSYATGSNESCGPDYSTANRAPTKYPLWDEGGYYRRTLTVAIDDGCPHTYNTTTNAYNIEHGKVKFSINAINASYTDVASSTGMVHWWSTMDSYEMFNPIQTNNTCKGSCDNFFNITCLAPIRTSERDIFPTRVVLACRDPTFGYVWRITNEGAPNLHMDWEIVRTIEDTTVSVLPLLQPELEVVLPPNGDPELTARLKYWDTNIYTSNRSAYHGYDLWPNATLKHGVAGNKFFYVPAFKDTNKTAAMNSRSIVLGTERPSLLRLYAGRPNHYEGTVAVGALFAYYDMDALLNMTTMRASGVLNMTAISARTYFPADRSRQTLIELCSNSSALIAGLSVATVLPTVNLLDLCTRVVNNRSALWNETLALVFAMFFPTAPAVVDPIVECSCADTTHSPCEVNDTLVANRPALLYDYDTLSRPVQGPINITLEPVCRMTGPIDVLNIPPLPNLTNVPGTYAMNSGITLPQYYNRLLAPFDITTLPTVPVTIQVNYSIGPWGVVWRINNGETILANAGIPIRWEVGQYVPPSGTTAGELKPVPYASHSATDLTLAASRSYWLFSRTLNAHKLYGNARISCTNVTLCATTLPVDPAPSYWSPASVLTYALDTAALNALPACACYVNIPCNRSVFMFNTPRNVDVTLLSPPLPPPDAPFIFINATIPSNCTPYPEQCNGLDDNCNGLVDDLPGAGQTCTSVWKNGPCALSPGVLQCVNVSNATNATGTFECVGQVFPSKEKCDFMDHDCDGVSNNVPGLNGPCGSDVGACSKGILQCDPPNPEPICNGSISALPAEICGNGIDDDCNGLVDDGCNNPPPPPPPPAPPSPATPVALPSPHAPSPPVVNTPDANAPSSPTIGDKIASFFGSIFGIDPATFMFNHSIWMPVTILVLIILIASCSNLTRHDTVYHHLPRRDSTNKIDKKD